MALTSLQSLSHAKPAAVALGNFDGVHLGHRRILKELQEDAKLRGLDAVALTFDPHPRHFLYPDQKAPLLTPLREKETLLRDCGVEPATLVFNSELANLSAADFASEVLIRRLHGELFLLGPGHRFGHKAKGDIALLRSILGADRVREIPPVIDETGELISSSTIRRYLEAGQVEHANRMLGRPYRLCGEVVHGQERGKQLGFPTANIKLEDERKAMPAFGVYGGTAFIGNKKFSAIGNIGLRPTFAGIKAPSVEVHVIGLDEDLYGQQMVFELLHYLRPEKAFDSLESLRAQISSDVAAWKAF